MLRRGGRRLPLAAGRAAVGARACRRASGIGAPRPYGAPKSRVFLALGDLAHTPALERSKKGGLQMRATGFRRRKPEDLFHCSTFRCGLVGCTVLNKFCDATEELRWEPSERTDFGLTEPVPSGHIQYSIFQIFAKNRFF